MNTGNQAIESSPSPLPSFAPTRANAPANPSVDTAQRGPMEGTPGGIPAPGQPTSGEPASGTAGSPLDRLTIQNSTNKTVRAAPLRPGLLNGNRDWIIPVECTAEAVVLYPSGQRIDPAELSRGTNGKNALFEAVRQMIVRRQSTVRPGEPPYRPMIRFRVRPDGLRSYYLAYPALEALHVPMSRENLEPEEKTAGQGR
jgi:hypothetical protein